MTARRIPIVQQAVASLLVAALGGFPVRALADQGAPAAGVQVQSLPPPPVYAPAQPAPPQQAAPQQQAAPAPQQPAYAPQQQAAPAPQQPAYAPQQQAAPAPQQPAYAPQQQAAPAPQQPAYAPQQQAAPAPQQPAYAPQQQAAPAPQQPAYAPQQQAAPAPQQPAYSPPQQQAAPAPQQPAYSPPQQQAAPAPQQPTYSPPAYAPPAAAGAAGAAAGAAVAAPAAPAPAPAPQTSVPPQQSVAPQQQAPTVYDAPTASPRLPPGAVPVPQSAAPAPTVGGEADLGSAPPPPPPPAPAPAKVKKARPSPQQQTALVDDRLIRLEWRPQHVEGNRGWGPMVQVPVMGPDKRPLSGRSLYSALGRNDLAEEYERRVAAKRIMGVGSALLLISGIAVGISAFAIHGCAQGDLRCWDDRDEQLRSRFYWSGGLVLGGAVLGIASSAYSAHPVSRDELIGLIREHNAEIRNQPGVRFGAMALPGGGGLSLAGNF